MLNTRQFKPDGKSELFCVEYQMQSFVHACIQDVRYIVVDNDETVLQCHVIRLGAFRVRA